VNTIVALKRKLRRLPAQDCELIACGHYHFLKKYVPPRPLTIVTDPRSKKLKQHYPKPQKLWLDQENGMYRLHEDDVHYLCCGSALKGYKEDTCSYIEQRGFSPTELGFMQVTIEKDHIKKVQEVIP
jgi:hypothetical protein